MAALLTLQPKLTKIHVHSKHISATSKYLKAQKFLIQYITLYEPNSLSSCVVFVSKFCFSNSMSFKAKTNVNTRISNRIMGNVILQLQCVKIHVMECRVSLISVCGNFPYRHRLWPLVSYIPVLQIRRGNRDNLGIIFHITP